MIKEKAEGETRKTDEDEDEDGKMGSTAESPCDIIMLCFCAELWFRVGSGLRKKKPVFRTAPRAMNGTWRVRIGERFFPRSRGEL